MFEKAPAKASPLTPGIGICDPILTIIKIATPKAMPVKEKIEITFKKPSFFLGFRYLKATNRSIFEINLNFFC